MGCSASKQDIESQYDDDDLQQGYRKPLLTFEEREIVKLRIIKQVEENKNGKECKILLLNREHESLSTLSTAASTTLSYVNNDSTAELQPQKPTTITQPFMNEEDVISFISDLNIDDAQNANIEQVKDAQQQKQTEKENHPVPKEINQFSITTVPQPVQAKQQIRRGFHLLQERLRVLSLCQISMLDDGNCQFRSIAHQLYGDANRYHDRVRQSIVNYMKTHASDFECYFDGGYNQYLKSMRCNGTWGDELTLRAASNNFNCNIHVISSEQEHYYVCYEPDTSFCKSIKASTEKGNEVNGNRSCIDASICSGTTEENDSIRSVIQPCQDVFLAYLSPVHFNSIHTLIQWNTNTTKHNLMPKMTTTSTTISSDTQMMDETEV